MKDIEFINVLKYYSFDKKLAKMAEKYKNKKVVLYGAGGFFRVIKENYDLSVLNITAVSDFKFQGVEAPQYDENIGFNIISPEYIDTLEPHVVLICVFEEHHAKIYFKEKLFKETKKKFKYEPVLQFSFSEKMSIGW